MRNIYHFIRGVQAVYRHRLEEHRLGRHFRELSHRCLSHGHPDLASLIATIWEAHQQGDTVFKCVKDGTNFRFRTVDRDEPAAPARGRS